MDQPNQVFPSIRTRRTNNFLFSSGTRCYFLYDLLKPCEAKQSLVYLVWQLLDDSS